MTITETVTKKIRLFSRRKVMTLLSGNYDSLFRGRGLELDSLRHYVPGDDVKDIDWKATARTSVAQTRVYAALRDQRIVIVPDTSRSMLLPGYSGLHKLDALYAVSVMLGNFVKHNHDVLGLCATDYTGQAVVSRFKSGSHHLESVLQTMDAAIHGPQRQAAPMGVAYTKLLGVNKKRGAAFIVTDGVPSLPTLQADLVRLCKRYQVFYVQLAPSSPLAPGIDDSYTPVDIETGAAVSPDVAASSQLQKEWLAAFEAWRVTAEQLCKARGAAYGFVTNAEAVPEILRTMFIQAKRYARHRR